MFVVQRNLGEGLIIETPSGERIEVKVSAYHQGGVQLSVDAAPSVTITRAELEAKQPAIIRKILNKALQAEEA